jgi:hypothetical protein
MAEKASMVEKVVMGRDVKAVPVENLRDTQGLIVLEKAAGVFVAAGEVRSGCLARAICATSFCS